LGNVGLEIASEFAMGSKQLQRLAWTNANRTVQPNRDVTTCENKHGSRQGPASEISKIDFTLSRVDVCCAELFFQPTASFSDLHD